MTITASAPLRCLSVWFTLLLLSGCATTLAVYDPIADPDFKGPLLNVARANPESFINTRVRWGGEIAQVENRRDETLIEVVQHRLDEEGRPYASSDSEGRFMGRFQGFLDPAIYAEGKQITVVGPLVANTQGKIGDYPYTYPVVAVERHKLWRERREPEGIYYYPDPFWYYPWYGPFYPWYPHYYYPHYRRRVK